MEPVTHLLTGACLSRTGLNRKTAYATLIMVVAAEFPDIDMLCNLRGPVAGFEHHRGLTHTFLGLPFEAAFLVALVYALDCGLRRRRAARGATIVQQGSEGAPRLRGAVRSLTPVPVRWAWLYLLALIALLSHLLLDYTNNYGLRPFYPFDPHWYAASIVFIFDPLIFAMLLAGLIGPALFGLVSSEVGTRRQPFRGRGWAIAALTGVVALWALRWVEHGDALRMAMAQSIVRPVQEAGDATQSPDTPQQSPAEPTTGTEPKTGTELGTGALQPGQASVPAPVYLTAQRALASPHPLNPFTWSLVTDFGPVYQLAEANTLDAIVQPAEALDPKPSQSGASPARNTAVRAAEASPLGRFYLNWSPMPFVSVSSATPGAAASSGAADSVVTFRDPRFMGDVPILRDRGESPLTATVTVDAAGHAVRQSMDGVAAR